MGLVTIFVAWEVMGGNATTNVVEMCDSDLDPIYNFIIVPFFFRVP